MTKQEAIEEVKKLVAAPSCCPEAKAAGEAYLNPSVHLPRYRRPSASRP